jgi:osmotically-inducible protein OsmY
MKAPSIVCVPACVVIAAGVLSACAEYRAIRKCGYSGCPGDAQITAQVQARLNQHPELRPPNLVYVHTLDKVVYLSGLVSTQLQREIAVAAAEQVPGKRRVSDNISIEYAGR